MTTYRGKGWFIKDLVKAEQEKVNAEAELTDVPAPKVCGYHTVIKFYFSWHAYGGENFHQWLLKRWKKEAKLPAEEREHIVVHSRRPDLPSIRAPFNPNERVISGVTEPDVERPLYKIGEKITMQNGMDLQKHVDRLLAKAHTSFVKDAIVLNTESIIRMCKIEKTLIEVLDRLNVQERSKLTPGNNQSKRFKNILPKKEVNTDG